MENDCREVKVNSKLKILLEALKVALITTLVFILYRSINKVLNSCSRPVQKIIKICIRLTVFLCIFLFLYSFLSVRLYSITAHSNAPSFLFNIFVSILFFISAVVGFFSTAVVENIYTLPSRTKESVKNGIDGAKEGAIKNANVSKNAVTRALKSTKETLGKVGNVTTEGVSKIYKNSMTVSSAVVGPVGLWISNKITSRKKKDIDKIGVKQCNSSEKGSLISNSEGE